MANEKFTPAPWYVDNNPGHDEIHVWGDQKLITTIFEYNESRDANAELIAQAPAMYEAMKKVVDETEFMHKVACDSVDLHNNMDGVGIDFDYQSYPKLPAFIIAFKSILAAARGEANQPNQ